MRELLLAVAPRARRATPACAMLAAERALRRAATTRPASRSARRSATGPSSAATSSRASGTPPAGASCAAGARRGRRPAGRARSRAASASGSCSTCCSPPTPTSCCSTSPTTSSTSRPSAGSRQRMRATTKTVLLISHDRELLARGVRRDRHARGQRRLGARRLLRDLPRGARAAPAAARRRAARGGRTRSGACASSSRLFKERARYVAGSGPSEADAIETRWKRFVDDGPAAARRSSTSRSTCACAAATPRGACVALDARRRSTGSCARSPTRSTSASASASSAPTARGKTHLMRLLAGERRVAHDGERRARPARLARPLHPAQRARRLRRPRRRSTSSSERDGATEPAMRGAGPLRPARGRAPLLRDARRAVRRRGSRSSASSSRATTCCCSTSRPTTSTSTPAEALETALDGFEGTVVAVSHDRAFLRTLDRFLLVVHDGDVELLADPDAALEALA